MPKYLRFDIIANKELEVAGVSFLPLLELLKQSDIISLHCSPNDQTRHIINSDTILQMKRAMLINTSRGGLIDTKAVIAALKMKYISNLGIDVYEQEEHLFFRDLSETIIEDDTIQRLTSFPMFWLRRTRLFTEEALTQITLTTLGEAYRNCYLQTI